MDLMEQRREDRIKRLAPNPRLEAYIGCVSIKSGQFTIFDTGVRERLAGMGDGEIGVSGKKGHSNFPIPSSKGIEAMTIANRQGDIRCPVFIERDENENIIHVRIPLIKFEDFDRLGLLPKLEE